MTVAAYREFAAELPSELWREYRADLADVEGRARQGRVLVAESGRRLVGVVAYIPPGADQRQWVAPDIRIAVRAAVVRALAVPPDYRQRGVGRALMEACLNQARSDGATSICLLTARFMRAAAGLYENLGFRATRCFRRSGVDFVVYARRLKRAA
jgi:ribosomal protein S18 acetylase RimI-like enzyme